MRCRRETATELTGFFLFYEQLQQDYECVPGQHEIGVGVVGSGSSGTPFDGVNLFVVGLQVVNASVLLHTPKLERNTIT